MRQHRDGAPEHSDHSICAISFPLCWAWEKRMAGLFSFTAGWQQLWTGRAEQGDKESQQQRSALQTVRHLANRPRREGWREQQSTHSPGLPSSRLNCTSRGYRDTVGHEYSPENTGKAFGPTRMSGHPPGLARTRAIKGKAPGQERGWEGWPQEVRQRWQM